MDRPKLLQNKNPIYIGGVSQNETENDQLKSLIDRYENTIKRRKLSDKPIKSKFIFLSPKQSKKAIQENLSNTI